MLKDGEKWFKISILVAIGMTLLIFLLNPLLSDVRLTGDRGPQWYYWKLAIRNSFVMIVVWLLFFAHLAGNLFLIYKRVKVKEYGFHLYNFYLLVFNFVFIVLHLLETMFLYDGLAQDMPIWTSQYSVIFILIVLLVMQMSDRGLFLGKKIELPSKANKLIFKIHGFLFTVAIVYTFWFHPMVFTIGHLTGFLYLFLLLIQISFLKNKIHYNKLWILLLEVLVGFHAVSVAFFVQHSLLWGMFLFGFGFIFVMTQIYTLKISKKNRFFVQVGFFVAALIFYLFNGILNIYQILWIPIIEYVGALLIIGLSILAFGRPGEED